MYYNFQILRCCLYPRRSFRAHYLKRAVNFVSDWFIELKTNPDSNLCKKWMKTVQSEFYNKNPWE